MPNYRLEHHDTSLGDYDIDNYVEDVEESVLPDYESTADGFHNTRIYYNIEEDSSSDLDNWSNPYGSSDPIYEDENIEQFLVSRRRKNRKATKQEILNFWSNATPVPWVRNYSNIFKQEILNFWNNATADSLIENSEDLTNFDRAIINCFIQNAISEIKDSENAWKTHQKVFERDLRKEEVENFIRRNISEDLYSSSEAPDGKYHELTTLGNSFLYYFIQEDGENLDQLLKYIEEDTETTEAINEVMAIRNNSKDISAIRKHGSEVTVGIEYEIPANGKAISLRSLDNRGYMWYKDEQDLLVSQETGPRTLEVITDVNGGIKSAALELDQRLEVVEQILEGEGIETGNNSSGYKNYFPGLHMHIGTPICDREEVSNLLNGISSKIPMLSLLTANADGEIRVGSHNLETISERQIMSLGGGLPNGHISYNGEYNTIEFRIADIHREKEDIEAIASAFLGLQKYFEKNRENTEQNIKEEHISNKNNHKLYRELKRLKKIDETLSILERKNIEEEFEQVTYLLSDFENLEEAKDFLDERYDVTTDSIEEILSDGDKPLKGLFYTDSTTAKYLLGDSLPSDTEIHQFLEMVGEGLEAVNVPHSGEYIRSVENLLERKIDRASDLDNKVDSIVEFKLSPRKINFYDQLEKMDLNHVDPGDFINSGSSLSSSLMWFPAVSNRRNSYWSC